MPQTVDNNSVAQDHLRAFIERIERMEEEKKAIADDIKEIYAEAKGNGFHVPVLRALIRIRKQDASERMEQEALLELYMSALGMQAAPRDDDDFDPPGRGAPVREQRSSALEMRADSTTVNASVSGQIVHKTHELVTTTKFDAETGEITDDVLDIESPAKASEGKTSTAGTEPALDGDASRLSSGSGSPADGGDMRTGAALITNSPETATTSSSVETKSGIGSARDTSAMPHPGVVVGPTAIALQAGTAVTGGESAATHAWDRLSVEAGAEQSAPADIDAPKSASIHTFTPKPHDGPVSSAGLARMHGCLHLDSCAGKWNQRCRACEQAWNDGAASESGAA